MAGFHGMFFNSFYRLKIYTAKNNIAFFVFYSGPDKTLVVIALHNDLQAGINHREIKNPTKLGFSEELINVYGVKSIP